VIRQRSEKYRILNLPALNLVLTCLLTYIRNITYRMVKKVSHYQESSLNHITNCGGDLVQGLGTGLVCLTSSKREIRVPVSCLFQSLHCLWELNFGSVLLCRPHMTLYMVPYIF